MNTCAGSCPQRRKLKDKIVTRVLIFSQLRFPFVHLFLYRDARPVIESAL
jgi:hypothetical protein